jgi:hypothetical protein
MFSSDRSIIAAFAGCLALAALGLWDHQQQQKPEIYCEGRAAAQDCRPQQYVTERAGIARPLERAISNPEPRSGQDHEKRDLAAQEASAVFAFWMVLISGFGTVVTTLATVLLYQQIRLTREAVEDTGKATLAMQEANEIAKINLAPTLRLKPERISLSGSTTGSTSWMLTMPMLVENVGQGDALHFRHSGKATFIVEGEVFEFLLPGESGMIAIPKGGEVRINPMKQVRLGGLSYMDLVVKKFTGTIEIVVSYRGHLISEIFDTFRIVADFAQPDMPGQIALYPLAQRYEDAGSEARKEHYEAGTLQ